MKKNILFLCTGNSCRSQMAEGWGKALKGDKYNFYSAGTKKHGLNPYAIKLMKEVGVDISTHTSNTTDELDAKMDIVITVCSDANENCPYFPGGKIIHIGFDDPPRLTKVLNDEEEILNVYRRVRDEIKTMITNLEERI
ncbi:arsenate reductase ArsC [Halobacteriovorax sp. ZH4_bin.1]|uniref:arsenate reductase ArsC n=1 Tax=unclassified Halobacteriovorax TaxID=2639665 RepID=UPI0037236B7B